MDKAAPYRVDVQERSVPDVGVTVYGMQVTIDGGLPSNYIVMTDRQGQAIWLDRSTRTIFTTIVPENCQDIPKLLVTSIIHRLSVDVNK